MRNATFLALLLLASPALAAPLAPGESPTYNAWVRDVQVRVTRNALKSHGFPRSARVVVEMDVRPDGSVSGVHALSSTDADPRYPALAERVVGRAGPFPPIPPSTGHVGARIVVPLAFHVVPNRRRHRY